MTTQTSRPWSTTTHDAFRVSHDERERAVAMLQDAFSEGRIDNTELDQRIEQALAAVTRADLSSALRGLMPSTSGSASVSASVRPAQAPRTTAATAAATSLERSWAMVAHWLGLVSSFVGPAIVAAVKGQSRYIREQALEAVNFQLTFLGASVALALVTGVTFGIAGVFFPLLGMAWLVLGGVAGLLAAGGNGFRYPFILRLFR